MIPRLSVLHEHVLSHERFQAPLWFQINTEERTVLRFLQTVKLDNVNISVFSICRVTNLTTLTLKRCVLGDLEPFSMTVPILETLTVMDGGLQAATAFHAPALVILDLAYVYDPNGTLWNHHPKQPDP